MSTKEQIVMLNRISEWLANIGKSREWLANQMGVSIGTVNGWFAKGSKRPIPAPSVKLLDRMLAEDALGEPKFSFFETEKIRRAMTAADYISYPEFAHDAVIAKADEILAKEEDLAEGLDLVAEEEAVYPNPEKNISK